VPDKHPVSTDAGSRRAAALIEQLGDPVLVLDETGKVLYGNPAAERFRPPAGARGRGILPLVHPDDRDAVIAALAAASARLGEGEPVEVRLQLSPDRYRWVEAVPNNQCHDPRIGGIAVSLRDVTARVEAEELFRSAFEAAPIGMALVAPDGRFLSVNRALCELLGHPTDVLLSKSFQDITHPEDLDADLEYVRQVLDGAIRDYSIEKRYIDADDSVVWVLLNVSLVRDTDGRPKHFISQIQDITARRRAEDSLRHDSFHDPLTGLPNRRMLDQVIAEMPHPTPDISVLFCDLDNLKAVNDEIGHAAGDLLLKVAARRISASLRPEDVVARYGGDEFVVLAAGASDQTEASRVSARITEAVERPVAIGTQSVVPRISVGFAISSSADVDAASVLARADAAMYAMKARSRPIADGSPSFAPTDPG
jgi:diguanylate cyclase (GGDEF)-like protein/PAS domain S-box-containing protein